MWFEINAAMLLEIGNTLLDKQNHRKSIKCINIHVLKLIMQILEPSFKINTSEGKN